MGILTFALADTLLRLQDSDGVARLGDRDLGRTGRATETAEEWQETENAVAGTAKIEEPKEPEVGVEPTASGLQDRCSGQMSYSGEYAYGRCH